MNKSFVRLFAAASLATVVLAACGRNPGGRVRIYPGTEKYEAAVAATQPKCVQFDPKRIGVAASISGKEKFMTDRRGAFRLESYRVSQVADRTDHSVSSAIFQVTDFEDPSSRAPRLAIEAECLDLKGEGLNFVFSPATEIDSTTGNVSESQPLTLDVLASGKMSAESNEPLVSAQVLPMGKLPEAAVFLGPSYAETYRTISFRVKESEDGALAVFAEFIGVDAKLSRVYLRVEAVYGWDAGE